MKDKELDSVYKKYHKLVNMTFTELLIWSKSELSKTASLNRQPIRRNLRLLSKNKDKWTTKDIFDANKTISYISRAKKIPRAKGVPRKELTRNEIALRSWGHDVFKNRKTKGPKF